MSDARPFDTFYERRREEMAREKELLPGFIILGAMKCGTTSMRHILVQNGDVFLPQKDLCFFDVDDIEQHGDYFVPLKEGWTFHDFERDFDSYYSWYKSFFVQARKGQLIGDNTTTYLASRRAPERIARLMPEVKLVAMLRDPVRRAYSHYWHSLFAGRISGSFEETLRFSPGNLLTRGYYGEQIARYREHFGPDQLKVILFEEFVSNQQAVVDDLTDYLGIEAVDLDKVDTHRNPAAVPVSIRGRRLFNRVFGQHVSGRTMKLMPNMPGFRLDAPRERDSRYPRLAQLVRKARNRKTGRTLPEMNPETRRFLQRIFRRANAGLSELIGQDVAEHWNYMKS